MPPKRRIINNSKPKVPLIVQSKENNDENNIESELKFDEEVLWCINQFEKLINSGKINDAKKAESMRAISTLKKSSVSKIQKIQLMKQYFKDYKSKMKDEKETMSSNINFENQSKSNGLFLKKKTENVSNASTTFLFNFQNDDNLSSEVEKLNIG